MQTPVAAVGAPPLIRLLSRLAGVPVGTPSAPPAGQMADWIDWPQAVALSRALDGAPGAADQADPAAVEALAIESARTRADLAAAIGAGPSPAAGDGPAAFQHHAQAMQRAIQTAAGHLRGELRERLAAGSAAQARLAAVDAVMEAALSPREHALLAAVPALLGKHFGPPGTAPAEAGPGAAAGTPARTQSAEHELRDLLLAELDLRFQPVEGLLAALRGT